MSIYSATVMLDKPSAYWRLGEASGDAQDISGNKLTMTANPTITYGRAGGLVNDSVTSILLAGSGYYSTSYIGPLLNSLSVFSIECLVNFPGGGSDSAIIGNFVPAGTSGYSLRWNGPSNSLQIAIGSTGGATYIPATPISPVLGIWHHIIATYDGTNARVYLDGALVAGPAAASYVSSTIGTQIGRQTSSGALLTASLEEIAIYTSVLSATRVTAHYNAFLGMPTTQLARQIEVYRLHKDVCISNGHAQKTFLHRANEGTLIPVPGFPNNMEYQAPDPRMSDNPTTGTLLWATWQPLRIRSGNQDAGDTPAARMWVSKSEVQFPAIDDNFVQIIIQDDDFISDDQGARYNIENPMLDPSGSFWTAVLDRVR